MLSVGGCHGGVLHSVFAMDLSGIGQCDGKNIIDVSFEGRVHITAGRLHHLLVFAKFGRVVFFEVIGVHLPMVWHDDGTCGVSTT